MFTDSESPPAGPIFTLLVTCKSVKWQNLIGLIQRAGEGTASCVEKALSFFRSERSLLKSSVPGAVQQPRLRRQQPEAAEHRRTEARLRPLLAIPAKTEAITRQKSTRYYHHKLEHTVRDVGKESIPHSFTCRLCRPQSDHTRTTFCDQFKTAV